MTLNFEYRSSGNIETDGIMVFVSSDELDSFTSRHALPDDVSSSVELGISSELFLGNYNEQKLLQYLPAKQEWFTLVD